MKHLHKYPAYIKDGVRILDLSINIDGLPLFNSNNKCVWPILCGIQLEPMQVFPVALTFGCAKPVDLEFVKDTVRDLGDVMQNGLEFENRIIQVNLKCIVCDAPARAMVKCVKQYSGYYGCERCAQKGVWQRKIIYTEVDDIELQTDYSFREQSQEEHHRGVSPFCDLPVDMVKIFSVDYMHQSCLGVMKRLLLLWMRGKKEEKMSSNQIAEISRRLHALVPR